MLTGFDKNGGSAVAGFLLFYYFAGRLSLAFCHRAKEYIYTKAESDFFGETYIEIHSIRRLPDGIKYGSVAGFSKQLLERAPAFNDFSSYPASIVPSTISYFLLK